MTRKQLVKTLSAVNKQLNKTRLELILGNRQQFSLVEVGEIVKALQGQEADSEILKTEGGAISFEALSTRVSGLVRIKGMSYKPVNLIKLLEEPQYFAFVAGRAPLRLNQNIISVIPKLAERLSK